jgi:hypothetical protein
MILKAAKMTTRDKMVWLLVYFWLHNVRNTQNNDTSYQGLEIYEKRD